MVLTYILALILASVQPTAAQCDSIAAELTAQGKYAEAVEMAKQGVQEAERADDMDMKISCLCTMSTSYTRLGELENAIDCIKQVYEYDLQFNNPADLSYDMNLMAAICYSGGRYEEAMEYILKSIAFARDGGDENRGDLAVRLGNASDIFRSQKRFGEAEEFATEAYQIDKEDGREDKVPVRLCQLAGCLAANGKIDEAIPAYRESVEKLEALGNKQSLSIACRELGSILENDSEAISYLEKAESLSEELGSARDIIEANVGLANRLQVINPSKAYGHLLKAYTRRDSLFNLEKTAEIDRLNVEYQTLEKESQLASAKSKARLANLALSLLSIIAVILGCFYAYVLKSKKNLSRTNKELKDNLRIVSERFASLTASHENAGSDLDDVKEDNNPTDNIQFTPREMDIIKLSCKGRIGKEIAADLGISIKTVDNIKAAIFHKVGVGTTLELVIYAIHNKLDK